MKKLKAILSRVLGVPEGNISDSTSPSNTDSWDSFNGLMIVSELEGSFNIKFTMEEITAVKNVGDIKKALERHGVKLHE